MWQGGPQKTFDRARADALIGKSILIGITYVDKSEKPTERKQFYGVIESISGNDGIKVRLKEKSESEYFTLPPDLDTLKSAPPGTYKLKSTGEEVINPDVTTQWTFKKPEN